MKPHQMLEAALTAALLATTAMAQAEAATTTATPSTPQTTGEMGRLASSLSDWAGGRSNADALVTGLHRGTPITLVTNGADHTVSMAGFTPSSPMSYSSLHASLLSARRSLARLGILHPTAEQIQVALIGGDVTLPSGATKTVAAAIGASSPQGNQLAHR